MPTRLVTHRFSASLRDHFDPRKWIHGCVKALMPFFFGRIVIGIHLLLFSCFVFAQEGARINWNTTDYLHAGANERGGEKLSIPISTFDNLQDTLIQNADSRAFKWNGPIHSGLPENNQTNWASLGNHFFGNNPAGPPAAGYPNGLSFKPNQIFIGASYLSIENSGKDSKGYGSLGVSGEYARYFTPHVGAMLDVGAYFHKETQDGISINYNQYNITAGPTFIPFNNPRSDDKKFSGNVHALVGLSSIMIKQSAGSYTDQLSKQGFTATVGGALDYHISPSLGIRVQADYTPTFFFNTTQNNVRINAGIVIALGGGKAVTTETGGTVVDSVPKKEVCKASGITTELKINLYAIQKAADALEKILKKIPRVKEPKVSVSPQLTVKRGEECCSNDKAPVTYTELKGGVEGNAEILFNLWGIPDIKYDVKLWPFLVRVDIEGGIFAGCTGKINLLAVGKYFGELGQNDRPDCKACYYLDLKLEAYLKFGIGVKGQIALYHWTAFGKGEAGFDLGGEPDEEVEVSAEASASAGVTSDGTYASDDCSKPKPGFHGEVVIGKAKANLKVKVKLGPLSFNPNLEIPLYDGIKLDF